MIQFKKEDTIVLLIDHQVGTLNFCANRPKEMIISRTRALARFAKALDIPVVLTSSQEDHAQGLLLQDLQDLLPEEYTNRVKREGVTNAWNDENYKAAILKAANGRKNVVMAGLTHDVCIVWPSISMQEEGFNVQVVIDAGGSPTQISDDIAQQSWEREGVRTTTFQQLVSEMTHSWATEDGGKVLPIIFEEIISTIGKFV
jgi:nicotinamidase-related amidase